MYYRRKLLLALIERFGGSLHRTDCLKLLFVFCQVTHRNYYDFFPYKFGGFSFLVYQDKNRLADLGFLTHGEDFELCPAHESFSQQIKPQDIEALNSLHYEFGHLRGDDLIRYTYLQYPQSACRSTLVSEILNQEEADQVRVWWNTDNMPCLFSIGYEGKTIDAYLNALIVNNTRVLLDVRKNPLSMKYGFSKNKLRRYVERAGLTYIHMPQLGIPSNLRKNLEIPKAYQRLFNYYQTKILPQQTDAIEQIRTLLHEHARIALTCFEADYRCCHRHKITEYLDKTPSFDTNIIHL